MTNVLAQIEVPKGDEIIFIKIRGVLVDILLEIDPENHQNFLIGEGQNKFQRAYTLNTECEILISSIYATINSGKMPKQKDIKSTHMIFELISK